MILRRPLQQPRPLSLREQKRSQLRIAVQEAAIDLFTQEGYHAVTMEQIARAAGISRSTLFRHFATKEAIVLYDSLDPHLAEVFRRQPTHLTVLEALRATLPEVLANPKVAGNANHLQRELLIHTVPELRATFLNQLADSINSLATLIAERTGKIADDIRVRSLAGALMGVITSVLLSTANHSDRLERLDEALSHLVVAIAM